MAGTKIRKCDISELKYNLMNLRGRFLAALAVFAANGLAQPYIISTVGGTNRLLDGNQANTVPLRSPVSISADSSGGFYISDSRDNRVRYVSALGYISTIAGTGIPGRAGDRGKATAAQLSDQSRQRVLAGEGIHHYSQIVGRPSPGRRLRGALSRPLV